jgi:hypothetical protein
MATLAANGLGPFTSASVPGFVTNTVTLHFADTNTAAQVSGSLGYSSNNTSGIDAHLGVCYQASGASSPTMEAGWVEPQFISNPAGQYWPRR